MQSGTDWARMWRELVEARKRGRRKAGQERPDLWRDRAREFHEMVKRRWAQPDSSREFILSQLEGRPEATVIDIGAGTGAWAILLAPHVRHVTAVEPSQAMVDVLQENLQTEGIDNVRIIQAAWPDVQVEPHDFSLCSHAMYGVKNLPTFIRRMDEVTRDTCFLLIRAPSVDGVMADAARRVWGHPHDSPNFQVGYNVLLGMGIYANVLMEDPDQWVPWTNESLEEALDDVRRRLGLGPDSEHDAYLADLLQRRLIEQDGEYVWPPGMRSALVYWGKENSSQTNAG